MSRAERSRFRGWSKRSVAAFERAVARPGEVQVVEHPRDPVFGDRDHESYRFDGTRVTRRFTAVTSSRAQVSWFDLSGLCLGHK